MASVRVDILNFRSRFETLPFYCIRPIFCWKEIDDLNSDVHAPFKLLSIFMRYLEIANKAQIGGNRDIPNREAVIFRTISEFL